MNHKIKVFKALCACEEFIINGIEAYTDDFGYGEDVGSEYAEPYCCGNRKFLPKQITQETLDKYKITLTEANQIQNELIEKLSWGSCGWCS